MWRSATAPPQSPYTYHAFHAVRQQHHNAGLSHPLGLAAGDELIDDHLGIVAEISKLTLPHDQRVGIGHRIAELETQHGFRLMINYLVDYKITSNSSHNLPDSDSELLHTLYLA